MTSGCCRRKNSAIRRRLSLSKTIDRSRNSRQVYSASIIAAETMASARRTSEISSADSSSLPLSPGVIVATDTQQPSSFSFRVVARVRLPPRRSRTEPSRASSDP